MTTLPRTDFDAPVTKGAWYTTETGSLWIICPGCLKPSHARYHLVDEHGHLGPRFTCSRYHPETKRRCGFKEWLILGEWPQGLIKILGHDGPKVAITDQDGLEQDDEV